MRSVISAQQENTHLDHFVSGVVDLRVEEDGETGSARKKQAIEDSGIV